LIESYRQASTGLALGRRGREAAKTDLRPEPHCSRYGPTRFKIQVNSRHASTAVVAPATPNQIAFCPTGANWLAMSATTTAGPTLKPVSTPSLVNRSAVLKLGDVS
jgi:hypothetical protein